MKHASHAGRVTASEGTHAMRVTVIIPTLNEQLHIERAVRGALPLGPVFVVDSLSTDRTREVAEAAGAVVVQNRWEGYARQKNWALDNLAISTDWILFLDADEMISPQLQAALLQATAGGFDAWYLPRSNIVLGKLLKHVWWYPDYQLRLFRKGFARYEERTVHEHMLTTGRVGYLDVPLVHENLKGVSAFLERHRRYAELEAREIYRSLRESAGQEHGGGLGAGFRDAVLAMRDRTARRRFVKQQVWYRIPCRPAVRFLWLYLVRRGFLDGRHGLVYAQLIAAYEAMIDAYLLELERGSQPKRREREPVRCSTAETSRP